MVGIGLEGSWRVQLCEVEKYFSFETNTVFTIWVLKTP